MAPFLNGYTNGTGRHLSADQSHNFERFSDVPSALDIQVSGGDAEEAVEISLEELLDDTTELCTLLENESAEKRTWMIVSLAYVRQKKIDLAIEILHHGLNSLAQGPNPKERLGPLSLLVWIYLSKCRAAPRVLPEGQIETEMRTKEHWIQTATSIINEAGRINPAFPPLYLARGVLYLLRASLQPPSKPIGPGSIDHSERVESLNLARQCFLDAAKVSSNRNMLAVMGVCRAQYSLGRYAEALQGYQEVLSKMPQQRDPDPRIGIGCCLWQLGFKEEAREAWERSLELNPDSKIATILIGLYYLHDSSNYNSKDPAFAPIYKKAMTDYTQRAYKLDKEMPLTCATFGGYFTLRRAWPTVEGLARKAIEQTDVNAVASDGWFLLARKEHHQETPDLIKVNEYYGRADLARGGGDRGFVPARFGIAQALVQQGDIDGAKFRLDKIIQTSKSYEAMMLLGALYAEEVFSNAATGNREDKANEVKKAIALFENVRVAWKDPSKKLQPDISVLVYLARLYEPDQPDRAYQCLLQVESVTINEKLEKEGLSKDEADPDQIAKFREDLSPQLLNDLGCFQYNVDKYDAARDLFQAGLNACVKFDESQETSDTDALVTTISFNLARTYEAQNQLDEARQVYEGLLARHDDYTDARTRLAYIELRQNPTEDGPKAIAALNETDGGNLEVRAMLGWYLSRSKKRATNIADDHEQKHYKKTLLDCDKHDRYSLTGMGNLYSSYAREMRRGTDKERAKRSNEYMRAIGYYDKVLQLDPKNAYAAQGIGICLVEDKKDLTNAVQIFTKVKDTIRDSSVLVNLGHVFCELKQFTRSIENYEAAIHKDRASDPQVLACLGRVYLLRGKQEKSAAAIRSSLDYSRRALALAPSQIHFKFNIAFVQIQLAQLLYSLSETQRTLAEVQAASDGLDEAIDVLTDIAQAPNPPYPKHDIEQRANMGRNTMRRQLERAIQAQKEYEEKNATKLQEAKKAREAELKRREDEMRKAEEAAAEQRRKIQEEREKMLQASRELAEQRAEEERRKEEAEWTTDSMTGGRIKRRKKTKGTGGGKRRKNDDFVDSRSGSEISTAEQDSKRSKRRRKGGKKKSAASSDPDSEEGSEASSGGEKRKKKKRKLARKSGAQQSKFKSSERVVDSDEDDDIAAAPATDEISHNEDDDMLDAAPATPGSGDDTGDEDVTARPRKARRRIEESDEDEEGNEDEDNAFAGKDVSMVDESVGVAGDAIDGGDKAGGMGPSAGDGFGADED